MDWLLGALGFAWDLVRARKGRLASGVSSIVGVAVLMWCLGPHNVLTAPVRAVGCPIVEWRLQDAEQSALRLMHDVVAKLDPNAAATQKETPPLVPRLPGC